MLVPELMRPGWVDALRMSVLRLPYERLLTIDARMREPAARPVIVPVQVVIDHGEAFVSETLTRACERLGISVQPVQGHRDRQGRGAGDVLVDQDVVASMSAGSRPRTSSSTGRDVQPVWILTAQPCH